MCVDETTIREVDRRLLAMYGDKQWQQRAEPLDELILTVLSQHTNDLNRDKAFSELKRCFPRWAQVLQAPTKMVAAAIKVAGLANQKAPRIKAILQRIAAANGGKLTLDFLSTVPVPDALAWLQQLPGVGPKTAACVLLFGFGKPVFPVDTHIYRIAKRLGWIAPKVSEARANAVLDSIVPDDIKYRLHLNLIQHGRKVCRAQRPRCAVCPLTDLCAYFRAVGSQNAASSQTAEMR
ncbi:Endonuclease III [bacterium HR17]|uniref:Endonuclease III n=1 Tax=Candidatus Fervidibacter japonicus TaxID=2035412 RepID=A0A2H5XD23_9BACT|nr:Endonuclease III [bacterium HR17]